MGIFKDDDEPLDIVETRQVKRITIPNVFDSILESFNLERGGIYTIKSLFINPGGTIKDYLGANRYNYTPPFRILIITTAIVLYLISLSNGIDSFEKDFQKGFDEGGDVIKAQEFLESIQNYFNLILWSLIPFLALVAYWLNKKKSYNYAEHLVAQTYIFCITNILTFTVLLDHLVPATVVYAFIALSTAFYFIYAYKKFTDRSWFQSIWHTFLIYFGSTIMWYLLIILIGAVIIIVRM